MHAYYHITAQPWWQKEISHICFSTLLNLTVAEPWKQNITEP